MSEQREALAEALYDADMVANNLAADSPGWADENIDVLAAYVGQANALLDSPALARMLADAEQRGAARVRFDRRRHYERGMEDGRAEVAAAVEAVLADYGDTFWAHHIRAALAAEKEIR